MLDILDRIVKTWGWREFLKAACVIVLLNGVLHLSDISGVAQGGGDAGKHGRASVLQMISLGAGYLMGTRKA